MKKKEYLQPQVQFFVGELHAGLMVTSYAIGSEGGEPGSSMPIEEDTTIQYIDID